MPWWAWVAVVYLGLVVGFIVIGEINRVRWERRSELQLRREVEEWLREH